MNTIVPSDCYIDLKLLIKVEIRKTSVRVLPKVCLIDIKYFL